MADDLGLLGVGPSDRKKLEAMGFTTLEQIVLLDRYALGLGKEKGDALVQRAANILCNHHIKDITAEENRVTVQVDRVSEAIVAAVKEVLGSYGSEYSVQENRTIIVTPARSPHSGDFHYVVKNARRRQEVSAAKRRDELQREGITLSQPELLEFARERGFEGFAKPPKPENPDPQKSNYRTGKPKNRLPHKLRPKSHSSSETNLPKQLGIEVCAKHKDNSQ
ncbi:MAG: hypothetical protein HYX97_02125 [Chloroflexi bacterium]|nr:hypothetical protein [Chloroflexota bacterium]